MKPSTFELFLTTPIIVTSEMDESTFLQEFEKMKIRQEATSEFVAGNLDVEDFLEILDTAGVDVDEAGVSWRDGISFVE
jgi:hypothetical protein